MLIKRWGAALAVVGMFAAAVNSASAQETVDGFIARTHHGAGKMTMPYRLFIPKVIPDARVHARNSPLIVYLHGSGGAGTDNLRQISGGNTAGTHVWTTAEMQAQNPAFVVAPQAPVDEQWSAPDSDAPAPYAGLVLELIESLVKEFSIDRDRIYLVGQSRGGRGAWDLVSKRPDLFAAVVPLCGDGNVARVRSARQVAIWAFHGAKDDTVPVAGSRELVAALKSVGSSIKYTEYPDAGHNVWTLAFAERELPMWLFAQKRVRH